MAGRCGGEYPGRSLQRAVVTAESIAQALSASVSQDQRLNEWNLGVIEGMSKDEAAKQHAMDWNIFSHWCAPTVNEELSHKRIAGGESMEDVRKRAVLCLEEACTSLASEDVVIAVTHGGVLGQLLRHSQNGATMVSKPGNACISRFAVDPGHNWEVLDWASVDHLVGEDLAPAAADYGR
ncbi:Phosphoglycerate mutase-like protein 4 [Durusdinium trenchii]|uniref:Phosphoglycerate mutase-like protein 4 n=1 Tax=Durusdinium trenchii TaxID=1381693 RepID=A0ABP0NLR4_9DINO